MKNNHHLLRTMKKQLRKEEESQPSVTQADQMVARLQVSIRKLSHPEDSRKVYEIAHKEPAVKATILKQAVATRLARSAERRHWLKSRGQSPKGDCKDEEIVCEHLYRSIDIYESGLADIDKLIWLLVALGVSLSPSAVLQSIKVHHRRDTLTKLNYEEWKSFLLDPSNFPVALQRLLPPKSSQFYISPSGFSGDSPESDLETIRCMIKEVHSEFGRIDEARRRLLSLWKEVDPKETDNVAPETVAEMLVSLGVAVELRAARSLMQRILGPQVFVQRREFLALFTRSFLYLHVSALASVFAAHPITRITECTRYIIMAGLGLEEYKPSTDIVRKLVELQPEGEKLYGSFEEYQKYMRELLLPPGYVPTPVPIQAKTVSKSPEGITIVSTTLAETLAPARQPMTNSDPPVIPITITRNMDMLLREDAEELRQTDPSALHNRIVISELRPASEKASMRSTVTDLSLPLREKRYSLQDVPLDDFHSEVEIPATDIDVKPISLLPSGNPLRIRRRKGHSRATTAPSSGSQAMGRTSVVSTACSAAERKTTPQEILKEFQRLVAFVPHSALGLFISP